MSIALATTVHDPENLLFEQMANQWPRIAPLFSTVAINASPDTGDKLIDFLRERGARIQLQPESDEEGVLRLGEARRDVVIDALTSATPTGATHALHCDFDRILHWAEFHLAELQQVVDQLLACDFTVLGRTPRAFDSHPRVQRDTERIINHVYGLVSGRQWDITAAARGISRRAADTIAQGCDERSLAVDGVWPLFVQQQPDLTMAYIETEGLAFETVDRFMDEADALGGVQAWLDRFDADPRRWAFRSKLAWIEIEAMQKYV